ncbi:MAG: YceI family protein [Polyangiales bacterium]
MPTFGPQNAKCFVFTYKDGLLAKAAHDLKLGVNSFRIELADDRSSVRGEFDPTSMKVLAAISDGGVEDKLKPSDLKKIESNIENDVLNVKRFPKITFESTKVNEVSGGYALDGNLTLHGVERAIAVRISSEGNEWVAQATVDQPSFGITPFKALMGAIRVQPSVRIEVRIPK